MVVATLVVGFLFTVGRRYLPVVMPVIFISYLIYGFVRPFISRRMREGYRGRSGRSPVVAYWPAPAVCPSSFRR